MIDTAALIIAGLVAATSLAVVSPQPDETVFSNPGDVVVSVTADAPLASGQRIELWVDEAPVPPGDATGNFALTGLVRGTHTVEAHLVDASGAIVARSKPVSFYMWKASRLFPNRQPPGTR